MQASAQRLTRLGLPMVEFPQSVPSLTEASAHLYELIKGGNLVCYDDAALNKAIRQTVAVETTRGWRLAKEKTQRTHRRSCCLGASRACDRSTRTAPADGRATFDRAAMAVSLAENRDAVDEHLAEQGLLLPISAEAARSRTRTGGLINFLAGRGGTISSGKCGDRCARTLELNLVRFDVCIGCEPIGDLDNPTRSLEDPALGLFPGRSPRAAPLCELPTQYAHHVQESHRGQGCLARLLGALKTSSG